MKSSSMLLLVSLTLSACTADSENADSFFRFAIEGPTWSGDIQLVQDDDPSFPYVTAVIYPAADGMEETSLVSFEDPRPMVSVGLAMPAKTGLAVLRAGNDAEFPWFLSLTRLDDNTILMSQEVSLNITEFEKGPGGLLGHALNKAVGNFDGVMIYTTGDYSDDGTPITESHTVSGNFEFYLR